MVSAPPPIALRKFFFPPPSSPSLSRSQGQLLLIPLFKIERRRKDRGEFNGRKNAKFRISLTLRLHLHLDHP